MTDFPSSSVCELANKIEDAWRWESRKSNGAFVQSLNTDEQALIVAALRAFDHAQTPDQWKCFHCGGVFTDAKAAANHFGVDHVGDETLCQMARVDGGIARVIADLSEELQRYRSEDNESYREFYRLGADHSQALIREEQKGYDRGLADGRALADTSTDRDTYGALDRAGAQAAAEAVCDYTDNNLSMMYACDMDTSKAQELYEAAKRLRDMLAPSHSSPVENKGS